jgi:tRNA(Ile)-lysidine synthase
MNKSLQTRVRETIQHFQMLRAGDRVAVGVSGGADSVALLLLLLDLREELGVMLLVAHFNHQLRGEESDEDEAFVQELSGRQGVEFACGREDVAAHARKQRWNIEDAARRLRYGFFEGLISAGRADRIAVGHTADDQAETVLARLVRGTGPRGLAGIYPVIGNVVRPLIQTRGRELRAELQSRGQRWREDTTNRDPARLRSRIRQRILPELDEIQPGSVEHLNELANRMREEEAFWAALLDTCYGRSVARSEAGLSIPIRDLLEPPALSRVLAPSDVNPGAMEVVSRRLIRRLVSESGSERGQLTARHVEQILRLGREGTSGRQLQLPGGVVVERVFEQLVFRGATAKAGPTRETTAVPPTYEYEVTLPENGAAVVEIGEAGKRVSLKVIDWSGGARDTSISGVILDRDLLCPPLILRNWRPGDAYRPTGHQGMRKLKRMLQEHGIPLRERGGWPVLTSGGKVAWAVSLPAAQEFAAGANTRRGLQIVEETL